MRMLKQSVFAAVVLAAAVHAQAAAEVWVGGAGAADSNAGTAAAPFATIAAGIDACDAGGVVHVRAGSYPVSAQIEVSKAVSVIGEGSASTVVYRQDPGTTPAYRVFYINHLDALVSGFTISNGCNATGAGVNIDANGGTLANSVVRECTVTSSGGIVSFGSKSTTTRLGIVTNCVIEKNVSTGWNAALPGVNMGRSGQLVDSVVRDNVCKTTAYSAYCGVAMNGGEILRCEITGNTTTTKTAPTGAGGVYVSEWGGTITDSLIAGNGYMFLYSGGIYAVNTKADLTISGCTIAGNRGSWCGGILVADNVTKAVNVADTIIQDNVGDFEWSDQSAEWKGPGFSFANCVCPVGFGTAPATDCVAGYVDFGPDYLLLYSPYGLTAGWKPYDAATAGANYGLRVDAARKAAGQAFAFTAYGYDPSHADLVYAWNFGDGATASGATATHAYAAPGAYTATLTVSSGGSPLATFTKGVLATSAADAYVVNAALNPGHVPAFPYATPATAATDIQTAIDAVADGQTVHVGPGTYTLTDEIRLAHAVTVVATEGRDATRLVRSVSQNAKGVVQRCASLSHPAARLAGFAISGGLVYWEDDVSTYYAASGAGVLVTGRGGTVADCAITNNGFGKAMYVLGCGVGMYSDSAILTNCLVADNRVVGVRCRGAGINIQGGLVTHCVVSNNYYSSGYTTEGCAIRAAGKCRVTHSRICHNSATGKQAGVALLHKDALIDNCLVDGNSASGVGGGISLDGGNGTIANCTIIGNTASTGAGVYATGNTRWALLNTVVAGNVGSGDAAKIQIDGNANGLAQAVASNCLSTAAFPFTGTAPVGCLVDDPAFDADGITPSPNSPLVDNGWNGAYAGLAADLDFVGNTRLVAIKGGGVDIGCVEFQGSPAEAHITASTTRCTVGYGITFSAVAYDPNGGTDFLYRWRIDGGEWGAWTSDPALSLSFDAIGDHTVELLVKVGGSEIDGGTLTVAVCPADVYVVSPALNPGWMPAAPYATPATAATNVLDALAATAVGGTVHVGPGLHLVADTLDLSAAIRVVGSAGRDATEIRRVRGSTAPDVVVARIVNMDDPGASVEGITLSNGYVKDQNGTLSSLYANSGAGVRIGTGGGSLVNCAVTNCTGASYCDGGGVALIGDGLVSNCVILANTITGWMTTGGGIYQRAGVVTHCVFVANVCHTGNGGSASSSALNCVAGRVSHCVITNNIGIAGNYAGGGGAFYVGRDAVVDNCLVASNASHNAAAGVYAVGGTIVNCTIADNVSRAAPSGLVCVLAQGRTPPILRNCIVQGNSLSGDGSASEYSVSDADSTGFAPTFEHCLAPVALAGTGNVQATARFRDASYTPFQRSPGVNAGSTAGSVGILSTTDVLGRPRVVGAAIDIGAVEADPLGMRFQMR